MTALNRDRARELAGTGKVADEVSKALEDSEITTTEQLLRRLFSGPPNSGVDNSYVPERFGFAKALLSGQGRADEMTIPGQPSLPWPHLAAPVFLSDQLVSEHEVANDNFGLWPAIFMSPAT